MAKKIYLSPSNQDGNKYATGNTTEQEQCDKIANATAKALQRCGFEVLVGKSGDTMKNRCTESDKFKADIHMPIHTNAYNGKVTGGTRLFCLNSEGDKACESILKYLGAISPGKSDSVTHHSSLYEINVPKALTVYVECEFHDAKEGSEWIINNSENIAEAICKGLCDYFNVKYTTSTDDKDKNEFKPYLVTITSDNGVNIRSGAGTNNKVVGTIAKGGAYTIVAESKGEGANNWGKLKSGAGWIALDYTQKIK